jgi:predicted protein tyrosine phosphatase
MIHVCSLAKMPEVVETTGSRHVVTLIRDLTRIVRPPSIAAENHLILNIDDIEEASEGMITPEEAHVGELLEFVRRWERKTPIVVHCFAGISRSTAAAFITACALAPTRNELEIAKAIRAASPTASPNPRIVGFGDRLLKRQGRMVDAVRMIGRGEMTYEAEPFVVELR